MEHVSEKNYQTFPKINSSAENKDVIILDDINHHVNDAGIWLYQHAGDALRYTADALRITGKKLLVIGDESVRLLLQPPINTINTIVRGPEHNDSLELAKNLGMYAFNPFLTIFENFTKANGDWTWVPLQPTIARAIEATFLLTAPFHQRTRPLNERLLDFLTGFNALSLSVLAECYALLLTDLTQQDSPFTLNTLLPNHLPEFFQQFSTENWQTTQTITALLLSYLMVTNAYIAGKGLTQSLLPEQWHQLRIAIRTDGFHRIDRALKKSPEAEIASLLTMHTAIAKNQRLGFTLDIISRSFETLLTAPSLAVTRAPRYTASHLTSYKPAIHKFQRYQKIAQDALQPQLMESSPEQKESPHSPLLIEPNKELTEPNGCCATFARSTFSLFSAVRKNLAAKKIPQDDLENPAPPPTYEQAINKNKAQYSDFASRFFGDKESRQNRALRDFHYRTISYYLEYHCLPPTPPIGAPEHATNPRWYEDALNDEKVKQLLSYDIANIDVDDRHPAAQFNQILFEYYTRPPMSQLKLQR